MAFFPRSYDPARSKSRCRRRTRTPDTRIMILRRELRLFAAVRLFVFRA